MNQSNRGRLFGLVGGLGLAAVAWVAWGFVGASAMALVMSATIAAVYLWGVRELWLFDQATQTLRGAAQAAQQPVDDVQAWLLTLPPHLRAAVRQRLDGERLLLPAPMLTPYLVGLLVMLGMLGTFLGMVVTFQGAVFALEGSAQIDALRSALAAPIKGLGLSFGTSVAGVAASGALGLLSSLCRRDRAEAARALEGCMATTLRGHTAAARYQDGWRALQAQAQALPQVVLHLQALVEGVQVQQHALSGQLQEQQRGFHAQASASYQSLAQEVSECLRTSLVASARQAAEGIRPVVEQAMADLSAQATIAHQRQQEAAQQQQGALQRQWQGTAEQVAQTWLHALAQQKSTQETLLQQLGAALQQQAQALNQHSTQVLQALQSHAAQAQAQQAQAQLQSLEQHAEATQTMAHTLAQQWQQVAAQQAQQQQGLAQQLQESVAQFTQGVQAQALAAAQASAELSAQSHALVHGRSQAEARWLDSHAQRTEQLAAIWRTEMGALRDQEAQRAQAAVQRLDALQAAAAEHLATLGAALEAPLTQLLHTASEVPRAAAEVIAELRQEMTQLGERDNAALAERHATMEQLAAVLATVEQATGAQRAAIDTLVQSATAVLEQASSRFAASLDAQSGTVQAVGAQVQASAIELATLGQAFQHGVGLLGQSHESLVGSLQTLEGSVRQSLERSDEQLAYYVAQAREVIDLSITSQQSLVEDLRRLHAQASEASA